MRRKTTRIIMATLLSGSIMSLAGSCTRYGISQRGGQITFGTVSGTSQTKTSYGDDFASGSSTWQYLNWEVDDRLTIASDKAGTFSTGGEVNYVSEYVVTGVSDLGNHQSKATVAPTPNGLCWEDGYTGTYQFYAVYPQTGTEAAASINCPDATGTITGTLGLVTAHQPSEISLPTADETPKYVKSDGTITTAAAEATYTYTVYPPDMDQAVMTAHAEAQESNATPQVSLHFQPAFTALEFNLTSKDENVEITRIELLSQGSDYIAGDYTLTAGDLSTAAAGAAPSQSIVMNTTDADGNGVAVTTTIGATFTLFTLPIANSEAITLKITSKEGASTKTAVLAFTAANSSDPFVFEAGKKYRVNLLKVPGARWMYSIVLDGTVDPWSETAIETNFSQQVQSSPFTFDESAIEATVSYKSAHNGSSNNYRDNSSLGVSASDPEYYSRYYQVRTLNTAAGYEYFTVTFTPVAPLGGYWQLSPSDSQYFTVKIYDADNEQEIDQEEGMSTALSGRIMNVPVILHVKPNWSAIGNNHPEYNLTIDVTFSPQKDFNPQLDANSEVQDVHGDGRFSYWLFTVGATN